MSLNFILTVYLIKRVSDNTGKSPYYSIQFDIGKVSLPRDGGLFLVTFTFVFIHIGYCGSFHLSGKSVSQPGMRTRVSTWLNL